MLFCCSKRKSVKINKNMLFGEATSYQEIFWKPVEPAFIEGVKWRRMDTCKQGLLFSWTLTLPWLGAKKSFKILESLKRLFQHSSPVFSLCYYLWLLLLRRRRKKENDPVCLSPPPGSSGSVVIRNSVCYWIWVEIVWSRKCTE